MFLDIEFAKRDMELTSSCSFQMEVAVDIISITVFVDKVHCFGDARLHFKRSVTNPVRSRWMEIGEHIE